MTEHRTSLVTAVEVRVNGDGPWTMHEVPVRREDRDELTALVFALPGGDTSATVVLTGGDRIALIELLGGTYDPDYHH